MEDTFSAATVQRIVISEIRGALKVSGWDQQSIKVMTSEQSATIQQEGDALIIRELADNLELFVPYETSINASAIARDVTIKEVRQVDLQEIEDKVDIRHINSNVSLYAIGKTTSIEDVKGDVQVGGLKEAIAIQNIQGNLSLYNIGGDVDIHEVAGEVTVGRIEGRLTVKQVLVLRGNDKIHKDVICTKIALVELPRVDGHLMLQNVQEAVLGRIGNTLRVQDGINKLHCLKVAHNCHIAANQGGEVILEQVGNDLFVSGVALLQVRHVGNHCQIQDSQQAVITIGHVGNSLKIDAATHVQVGKVGSSCTLHNMVGNLYVGKIGASLELQDAQGNINVGKIGANARIAASFLPESMTRLYVGGNAEIVLPADANLRIQAKVGGQVRGRALSSHSWGNNVNLVYGNGAAQLELQVGGNLKLDGAANPQSSSSSSSSDTWNWNWDDLASEMTDLGSKMGLMGQDLSAQINAIFEEATASINANLPRAADKHRYKQQEMRTRATQRAQERAQEKAARFKARFNNREWYVDNDQLERIIEQARGAAADGIEGALEAVEQALKNVNIIKPMEPMKPMKPMKPMEPMKPFTPFSAFPQESAVQASENTAQVSSDEFSSTTLEQEREAILHMIAGGRITPEEGDMLLEALGD